MQAEVADKQSRHRWGGEAGSRLGAIPGRLLVDARKRAPASLSAYDLWLLAREQSNLRNKAANVKGLEYAEKAVAIDPNFAPAYTARAWLKWQKFPLFGLPWATQMKEFGERHAARAGARSVHTIPRKLV